MKIVQHKQSLETEQNLENKFKRGVHCSARTDNGSSVNGSLYTGTI